MNSDNPNIRSRLVTRRELRMSRIEEHLQVLLAQFSSPLWNGYTNMLKTLESMFLSPKHWILEFLQLDRPTVNRTAKPYLGRHSKLFEIHDHPPSISFSNMLSKYLYFNTIVYLICDNIRSE